VAIADSVGVAVGLGATAAGVAVGVSRGATTAVGVGDDAELTPAGPWNAMITSRGAVAPEREMYVSTLESEASA
jgi:hypothetical protein